MNRMVLMIMTYVFAVILGVAFVAGLVWSLIPFGGDTLPHWVEHLTGVSFGWSALLISSLLGFSCVGCIAVTVLIQALATDTDR